ncbi:RtcB family protein [Microcoleus sp. A2-C5]
MEAATAAYKPIQPVIDVQIEAQMVGIVAKMKPVLTFKEDWAVKTASTQTKPASAG